MQNKVINPKVTAFLLVWNNWQSAVRSLESLFEMRYPNFNVVVMDQASEDGTIEKIKEWAEGKILVEGKYIDYKSSTKPVPYVEYREDELASMQPIPEQSSSGRLTIIKNKTNHSYYRARRLGIEFILKNFQPDWVLTVDNDIIVPADFLQRIIAIAEKEPQAGILGPIILDYDTEKPWHEGGTFNRWTGNSEQGHPSVRARALGKEFIKVDWLPTCNSLFSRRLFEKIGLWEADTPLDVTVDIGLSANEHGFKVLYVPSLVTWNDRVNRTQSEDYKQKANDRWSYYLPKAELFLIRKYCKNIRYLSAMMFFSFRQLRNAVRFLLFSRRWHRAKLHIKAILDYLFNHPRVT